MLRIQFYEIPLHIQMIQIGLREKEVRPRPPKLVQYSQKSLKNLNKISLNKIKLSLLLKFYVFWYLNNNYVTALEKL